MFLNEGTGFPRTSYPAYASLKGLINKKGYKKYKRRVLMNYY